MDELSKVAADEAERLALAVAVAAARADSRPDVPHEAAREEIMRDIENLKQKVAAQPAE